MSSNDIDVTVPANAPADGSAQAIPATNGTTHTPVQHASPTLLPPKTPEIAPKDTEQDRLQESARSLTGQLDEDERDALHDSEAETVICSPVKEREEAKRAQSIKRERTEENTIPVFVAPAVQDVGPPPSPPKLGGADGGYALSPEESKENRLEQVSNASDGLSDVSSLRFSPARSGAGSEASSGSRMSIKKDEQRSHGNGGVHLNPRKRKHRGSSTHVLRERPSMEPPRQRPRGDPRLRESAVRSSVDRSPSPVTRSHRRTTSIHSSLPDSSGNSNRKRQTVPSREDRQPKPVWNSESSSDSEASSAHTKNGISLPKRDAYRAVSTPGRTIAPHRKKIDKHGLTILARACERGDLEGAKQALAAEPQEIDKTDYAGNTPLQHAALKGQTDVVAWLIKQGCLINCINGQKDTPLIDAVENGHLHIVRLLLQAGANPLHCNEQDKRAIDLIPDDADDKDELYAALLEATSHADPAQTVPTPQPEAPDPATRHDLDFLERTTRNLRRLAEKNDRVGVQELMKYVQVDNTVLAAAAKGGHRDLLDTLKSCMLDDRINEKPMLAAIGTPHLHVIEYLLNLDDFNPCWYDKEGRNYADIAEEWQGPKWEKEVEILGAAYKKMNKSRRLSSSLVTRGEKRKRRRKSETPEEAIRGATRRLISRKERDQRRKRIASESEDESSGEFMSVSSERVSAVDNEKQEPQLELKEDPVCSPEQLVAAAQQREEIARQAEEVAEAARQAEMEAQIQADAEARAETSRKVLAEAEAARVAEREAAARKAAQEQAEAEAARIAEAEAARMAEEAARVAEEAARMAEEAAREQEQRILRRSEMLQKLPSALQHVLQSESPPSQSYLYQSFCPVQAIRYAELHRKETDEAKKDEMWCLSWHAGLLGKTACSIFDVPEVSQSAPTISFEETLPVDASEREEFLSVIAGANLVYGLPELDDNMSFEQYVATDNQRKHLIHEARSKLLSLHSLRWIKLDDLLARLGDFPVDIRTDLRIGYGDEGTSRTLIGAQQVVHVDRVDVIDALVKADLGSRNTMTEYLVSEVNGSEKAAFREKAAYQAKVAIG
ncbi:hypothetical protein LTR66_004138 [Elasticomyces elasticus]|nr:hypothetical protein LTR66_004138 [Elasticomyces elasticus]